MKFKKLQTNPTAPEAGDRLHADVTGRRTQHSMKIYEHLMTIYEI